MEGSCAAREASLLEKIERLQEQLAVAHKRLEENDDGRASLQQQMNAVKDFIGMARPPECAVPVTMPGQYPFKRP